MTIGARVESSGLRAALARVRAAIPRAAEAAVRAAAFVAKASATGAERGWKSGTGRTLASIHTVFRSSSTSPAAFVEAGGASAFLERGTRPHVIAPKARGFLTFVINGTRVYTTKPVRHPGTKPTHFLRNAAAVGADEARRTADREVADAIGRNLGG